MKRFLAIFAILMIAVLLSVPMTVSAAEAVTEVTEESVDLLYRVKEFLMNHGELLGTIGSVVGGFVAVIAYVRKFKNAFIGGSDAVQKSQGSVVDAMNTMIKEYNAMMKQNEEMYKLMQRFFATASAVELESKTVLDILERVYVNNKNLPAGVKDMITQMYANCKLTASGLSDQVAEIREELEVVTDAEGVDVA